MSVYVTTLPCPKRAFLYHMVGDTNEEGRAMAAELELRSRPEYEGTPDEHYHVGEQGREFALHLGAQPIGVEEFRAIVLRKRKRAKDSR